MEYIVLASSPGIATQALLDLFNNPNGKTVFIEFAALRDAESVADATQIPAARIVFHGEYNTELVNRIHTALPTTKNILVFDTAEAVLLQELARHDTPPSLDSCISQWAESIRQLTLLAEQNASSSVLVNHSSLTNATAPILALLNTRLGMQFTNCSLNPTNYSGIARLIAAAVLIDRDEAMVLYDDAITLALTSEHITNYTDAASLITKQQPAALNELHTLLRHLSGNNPINNLAAAAEQQQQAVLAQAKQQLDDKENELEIAQLQIQHLQNNLESMHFNNKQSELEIALLQISHLQEELENLIEKYSVLDRPQSESALLEKMLGELPLLGLLRNQTNTSVRTD